ncbi:MAG: ArdC-like ssDNA-binding domain-containing protein [Cellulomonas sp.]
MADPRAGRATQEEKLAALHQRLVTAVEELAASDAWRNMLTVAARFPTYSPSNVLLIALQRPEATRVAGFRTWTSLGRHVIKGEHGIAILAPCLYRGESSDEPIESEAPRNLEPPSIEAGGPDQRGSPHSIQQRHLRGFRVVHVFDLSQTDGEPLADVAPELLRGASPGDLWKRVETLIAADGYVVERGDCSGANGYTDYANRTVRVRDDVDPAQAVKTLLHEAGHIRGGHQQRFPDYHSSERCRGVAEVEAESIAYLVANMAGVDASGYSVPYVANWSGGDVTVLHDTAARVLTVARAMAGLLEVGGIDATVAGVGRSDHVARTRLDGLGVWDRGPSPSAAGRTPEA